MSIYIEYVIIDNMVMDYIIIKIMEMTVGIKFEKFRKLCLCACGAIFALILPLIMKYKLITFLYKILSSIILVFILKKYKKLKMFLAYYLMFFAYTFFVGGVCLGLIQLLGIEYTMSSVVMYKFDFPFGIFGIIFLVVIRVMAKVIRVIKSKLQTSNYIRKIKIVDNVNSVDGYAFVDTGNNIKYNGQSVSVISLEFFLKLYKGINIQDLLLKKNNYNLKGCEYISISGIGKSSKYLTFIPEYIEIDGKQFFGPRLAVSWKNFGEYDVVLNSEYIGGGL